MQTKENDDGHSWSVSTEQNEQPARDATDAPAGLEFDEDIDFNFDEDFDFDFDVGYDHDVDESIEPSPPLEFAEWGATASTLAAVAMPGSRDQLLAFMKRNNTKNADNPIMLALKEWLVPMCVKKIELNIEAQDVYDFLRQNSVKELADMRAFLAIIFSAWLKRRNAIQTDMHSIAAGIMGMEQHSREYDIMRRFEQRRLVDRFAKVQRLIKDLHDVVFYCVSLIVPENIFGIDYDTMMLAVELRNAKFDCVAALLDCLCESDLLGLKLVLPTKQRNLQKLEFIGAEQETMINELIKIPSLVKSYEVTMACYKHHIVKYANNEQYRQPVLKETVKECAIKKQKSRFRIDKLLGLNWMPWIICGSLVTYIYAVRDHESDDV